MTKQKSDIEKNLLQINQASAQLVKLKQQYIKLLDESQREGDTLVLLKKNLEHIIQQQSEKDISLSGDHMRHKESSLLYDRFLSVFDIPSTPEQEIERQVMRLDKLEKEKEKKRKEMEAKKTQLLFALEEKDRLWAAVSFSSSTCLIF